MTFLRYLVVAGVVMTAIPVSAQSPTDPAHPALPWALGLAIPEGQLIRQVPVLPGTYVRDIWIPPQPVVVDAMVATPSAAAKLAAVDGAASGEGQYSVLRSTYVVPGYYVRETTVGFHYPERWILDDSYTWRLLPAEFRYRPTVLNPRLPPAPASVPSLGANSPQPPSVPTLR
jgi:hypothetical protein